MSTTIATRGTEIIFRTTFFDVDGVATNPNSATIHIRYPVGTGTVAAAPIPMSQTNNVWTASWESAVSDLGKVSWSMRSSEPALSDDGYLTLTGSPANPSEADVVTPNVPTVPAGAYAFADFENSYYWLNGSAVAVSSIIPDMAPGTDGFSFGWQATDAIRPGYGATSGWDFGGYFKLDASLMTSLGTDYTIVLDCVFDYAGFSILEVYTYEAAVSQFWDFFIGAAGGGFNTFEMDDYLNLLDQEIGITQGQLTTTPKIGFSADQASGAVFGALKNLSAKALSATALAGHRSPPQAAWANLVVGISATYGGPASTPASYIRSMTVYSTAQSAAALQVLVDT